MASDLAEQINERQRSLSMVLNRNRKDYHVTLKATQQSPVETAVKPAGSPVPDQIAALAYTLWQQKGCPEGSREADWLQAEEELAISR